MLSVFDNFKGLVMTTRRANGTGGIYRRRNSKGKDTGNWLIKFYDADGKAHYESSGSNVKKVAQDLLEERRRQARAGELAAQKVTFDRLAQLIEDDYRMKQRKSFVRVKQCLKHLRRYFGDMMATEITVQRGRDYHALRLVEKAKPATIKNELGVLARMFSLAYKAEMVPRRPPFDMPEVRNARQGFFSEAELRTVSKHLPAYMRPFVWFLFYTGWRRGEAMTLKWSQVDMKAKTLRLEPGTTKNDRGRELPFGGMPQLDALLRQRRDAAKAQQLAGRIVPWVFFQDNGDMIGDYRDSWQTACKKAKLPGRLVHDLRRSAVRNLIAAGVDEKTAMAITGHVTRSVFDRYHIVSGADVAEAMAKVAARLS